MAQYIGDDEDLGPIVRRYGVPLTSKEEEFVIALNHDIKKQRLNAKDGDWKAQKLSVLMRKVFMKHAKIIRAEFDKKMGELKSRRLG